MAHIQIIADNRTVTGNSVRKLRKEGILPAVVYSKTVEPINIQLNALEFIRTFKQSGKTQVVDITVNNKKYPCIIHDLDVHPVTNRLRHVDFLAVNLKEKVVASVPVEYVGESAAVKESGGILVTNFTELEVEALPDDMPQVITVDITKLASFDDVIYVKDLAAGDKYTIVEDEEQAVASVTTQDEEPLDEVVETVVETGTPKVEETK